VSFNILNQVIKLETNYVDIKELVNTDENLLRCSKVTYFKNEVNIRPTFAGDTLIYLFVYKDKIFITNNIQKHNVKFDLDLNAIGSILNWGIIPFPHTPFKNVYRLGIGQDCTIKNESFNAKIIINQKHFFNKNEIVVNDNFDEKKFEQLFIKYFEKEIVNSEETVSMTSAGKDSTLIAIICSILDYKKINFVTYNDKSTLDETLYSKLICEKLNLKFTKINSIIDKNFFEKIDSTFVNAFFPVVDNATIPYLFCANSFKHKVNQIIDGMGNDIYLGHILNNKSKLKNILNNIGKILPNKTYNYSRISNLRYFFRPKQLNFLPSNYFNYGELNSFINFDYNFNWLENVFIIPNKKLDLMYYKALTRGVHYDYGVAMEKNRFVCAGLSASPIFPWTNTKISKYLFNLKSENKFIKEINKVCIRGYLNHKIDYKSFNIPKTGFGFESEKFILQNKNEIYDNIIACKYFNKDILVNTLDKNLSLLKKNKKYGSALIGLYIVSKWLNKCKYIN
tara:strand:+ start:502 stop:2028 length:1527 start_codon:yes stop_codon:yes gene_type:complete